MSSFLTSLRTRIVPAILTAAGIALVAAGLLTYSSPVEAGLPGGSDGSAIGTPTPLPTLGLLTLPPLPTDSPPASGSPGDSPSSSPGTTPTTSPDGARVVTRLVISALDIDLPVVKPPSGFPYCNVAMYLDVFSQPGEPGATYLFAHARTGMFLPLLTRSQVNNGASMLGLLAQVYTSDDQMFLYKIFQVRRHFPFDASLSTLPTKDDQLWLQTSEGTTANSGKLEVVAQLLSVVPADHAQAHPKPHPVICF
jgi:hypothetical protein